MIKSVIMKHLHDSVENFKGLGFKNIWPCLMDNNLDRGSKKN